eukprot:911-Heterococcus_DN1.PRE.1
MTVAMLHTCADTTRSPLSLQTTHQLLRHSALQQRQCWQLGLQAERATTAEASDTTTNAADADDTPPQLEQPRVLTNVDARVLRELMNDPAFMSSVALKEGVKEQLNEMQGGSKAGDSSSSTNSSSDDFSSRTFQAFQSLSLGWGGFVAQVTAAVESAAIAIQNKACVFIAT